MSFLNLFGGGNSEPAAPATPNPAASTVANPGNIPDNTGTGSQGTPGAEPNGAVPPGTTVDSPLDQFKDLWEPIKNAAPDGKPAAIDPTKLQEVIGKADFTKAISQDNLAAIAAGGEGALKATMDALNVVARQVMTQSTLTSNNMINDAVAKALEAQTAKLPQMMKEQGLSESLSVNPVFSNPAVKPVIDAVKSQLAGKYPNASVQELTTMANNFVTTMAESFIPKPPAATPAPDEVDWNLFMQNPQQ